MLNKKTVRFNFDELIFLAGALSVTESRHKETLEMNLDENLNQYAKDQLEKLEKIKKKLGINFNPEIE